MQTQAQTPLFYEWYWSEASAREAAASLEKKHSYYTTKVRIARRADLSHDWIVEVFEK